MWTLGINWKYHDASAALVDENGSVIACTEEERFTRKKHAWGQFPVEAVRYCLSVAGISWQELGTVAVGWAIPHLAEEKEQMFTALFGEAAGTKRPEVVFVDHHLAHALSSYHASGYGRAGVVVVDGSGEVDSATIFQADDDGVLTRMHSWDRQFSLGAMYSAATQLLGFGVLDAGKTMGLAPYGRKDAHAVLPVGDFPAHTVDAASPVLSTAPAMHFDVFARVWREYLAERFGRAFVGTRELQTDPKARALAASVQETTEEAIRQLYAEAICHTGATDICFSGGVAQNCVANGLLPANVYVPPFPHDAGVALGAAWYVTPPRRRLSGPITPYLGLHLKPVDEVRDLAERGCRISKFDPEKVVSWLLDGRIGAIAEGRAEVGPRALGHRSIIALPRPGTVQDRVNGVKGRETWRPFAPVTFDSFAPTLWPGRSPRDKYMNGTVLVSAEGRRLMPAVTHVDGTTRPQTLSDDDTGVAAELLRELNRVGAHPILVNTSFNGPGEPIVNSSRDAVDDFLSLGLDFLILDDLLISRPGSANVRRAAVEP